MEVIILDLIVHEHLDKSFTTFFDSGTRFRFEIRHQGLYATFIACLELVELSRIQILHEGQHTPIVFKEGFGVLLCGLRLDSLKDKRYILA